MGLPLGSTSRLCAIPAAGQMSHASGFDAMRGGGLRSGACVTSGRSAVARRRVSVAPVITKHSATVFWAGLVAARCRSREHCADLFGVTFQTACNWFDGFSCPTGDKVLMAMQMWPDAFGGALAAGQDQAVAA